MHDPARSADPTYRVGASGPEHAERVAPGRQGPVAILVAHGMGQQVPFETLDAVAERLLSEDHARRGVNSQPIARTVQLGEERLQRLELTLGGASGTERDVHVYEAYWAPLTEGQVKLRDVIAFLVTAGRLGIRAARSPFRRWLFGADAEFPAPVRTLVYLIVAVVVLASLGVLNAIILAMAAFRAPMQTAPSWLSDALFTDITSILNILVVVFLAFGVTLGITRWLHKRRARPSGWPSLLAFGIAVWVTAASAIAAVFVVVYHSGLEPNDPSSFFDRVQVFGYRLRPVLDRFDRVFDVVALALAAVLFAALLLLGIWRIERALFHDVTYNQATSGITSRVAALFVLLVTTLAALAASLLRAYDADPSLWARGLAWPMTVAASAVVRWFLIEFAGDVAAYVEPQVVDRFAELRTAIKETVWKTARAVYSFADYEDIIVVGHSLGSVVVYDVLNRMILDRALNRTLAPEVVSRTRLLLTFGSPLDKTAFLFGIQGPGNEAGAARRALAASVQPLITQPLRPVWVNVYSPWDIISGSLDYYDRPEGQPGAGRVTNVRDEDATTFLAAHVEYWENATVFKTILDHLP